MTVHLKVYAEKLGTINAAAEVFKFPGGELHLRSILPPLIDGTWIADVRGAATDDLVTALLLADHAAQLGQPFVLFLPYLPAARADRGTPFGLRVYADMINNCAYAEHVMVIDPHSPVANRLVRNICPLEPLPLLDRALESQGHWRYDAIIAPDKGAVDRAGAIAKHYGLDLVVCDKERDFETGRITKYKVPVLSTKGKYLVVDDICDGGGTFALLASEALISKSNLDLWVTHGIFSGAATNLRNYYGRIMTTDSHPGHNRVGVATSIVPTFTYMHQAMVELKGIG
ncbi:phosphoribosyl pyrophosphate transferase [Mycobacterium phage Tourach]|uniref:Phosphoribosyl pyrophosphate transferase n=1 Tax=Mycobacterium phage Tourach TaxID=2599882 RepID=A0A5J6U0T7_9CAUD|nr:ribose-phosphate pyrophosphokinase [Mycobacterium phage Tourach]QFG14312.1 phosphoribosyl pyrophosphate transferase [Mycobacterium phage Tourach]